MVTLWLVKGSVTGMRVAGKDLFQDGEAQEAMCEKQRPEVETCLRPSAGLAIDVELTTSLP